MEFQDYIERLKTAFISQDYTEEIKKAKKEFIAVGVELGNEIEGCDDDLLDIFFDWYIFDRPQSKGGITPLRSIITGNGISEDDMKIYSDFEKNIPSVFIVKKNSDNMIKVQDIFTKNKYEVNNVFSALLEKGDVIETRLLPFRGGYGFSGTFSFYPKDIYPLIKGKAKEARRQGVEDFTVLLRKFRRLKTIWGRCSNMDIKKVYALMEEGRLA